MKPRIESTRFGSITIDGEKYKHDVIIRLNGQVVKRKKKLSKKQYGTSHILSLQEAEHIYEPGAEGVIFGSGQFGKAGLSEEAADFFTTKGCRVELMPTPEAIQAWNEAFGSLIGLFHITC
jgi:hypothetical protein